MKNGNWIFWTFGIGSAIFMGFTLYFNYNYAVKLGIEKQGLFGDMFGASNALFTGLSFVGVIIAILLQRQELKLQRNELELTRNEMELTRDEFTTQNKTLSIQRFENTFFQLVSLHHSIISDMRYKNYRLKNGSREYTYFEGRSVFTPLAELIYTNVEDNIANYNVLYKEHFRKFGDKYMHYIRNIFQIIIMIENQGFSNNLDEDRNEKEKYVSIVWNQLSDFEITIIFYHCCFEEEKPLYKDFIEKYSLLRNLKETFVYDEIKALYSERAFSKVAP